MARRKKSAASLSRQPGGHTTHRTNNLVLGHVGRVTYAPRRDEDEDDAAHGEENISTGPLGELFVNRIFSHAPIFQAVIPFSEWYPPSIPEEPPRPLRRVRAQRSQQRWLLRSHPEAFMGNTGLSSYLREETRLLTTGGDGTIESASSQSLPLLAIGEITDATDPRRVVGCAALAMASGEFGDVLRVVKLREERRTWAQTYVGEGAPSLLLAAPDASYEGFWREEGVPITQVKFALYTTRTAPRRWLLVQTALSTMIFEPAILEVPVWTDFTGGSLGGGSSSGPSEASYISVSPIATVSTGETGGLHHSDVSFSANPGVSVSNPPQLAIIDRGGNWTVWDMMGNGGARHKSIKPVLRFSGSFQSGPSASLADPPPVGFGALDEQCRIAWILPTEKHPRRRNSSRASSSSSPSLGDDGDEEVSDGSSRKRRTIRRSAPALVLCTRTSLKLLDGRQWTLSAAIEVADPRKAEHILDMRVCFPESPSKVFVLTSSAVFWLELGLGVNPGQQGAAASATILQSCPHLRSPIDDMLKMSVAQISTSRQEQEQESYAWLVVVSSGADSRATLFTFVAPSPLQKQALFHHQTAHLAVRGDQADSRIRSLLLNPGRLSSRVFHSSNDPRQSRRKRLFSPEDHYFAQILVLSPSLCLRSALYAISTDDDNGGEGSRQRSGNLRVRVPYPTLDSSGSVWHGGEAKRKRLLKHFRDGFVIRDDFASIFDRPEKQQGQTPTQTPKQMEKQSPWAQPTPDVMLSNNAGGAGGGGGERVNNGPSLVLNLSPIVRIVREGVLSNIRAVTSEPQQQQGIFATIRSAIVAGIKQCHLPLTTFLSASGGPLTGNLKSDIRGSGWTASLQQLRESVEGDEMVRITELAVGAAYTTYTTNAESLFERLLHLWSSGLPPNALSQGADRAREALIGRIAMEIFLSQIGVSVAPPERAPLPPSQREQSVPITPGPEEEAWNTGLISPLATPPPPPTSSSHSKGKGRAATATASATASASATATSTGTTTVNVEEDGQQQDQQREEDDKVPPQDDAAMRLSRHAVSIGHVPRREKELLLLSHWPKRDENPGGDVSNPYEFVWSWGSRGAAKTAAEAGRKMRELRHQRKAERRAMMGLPLLPPSSSGVGGGGGFFDLSRSSQQQQQQQPQIRMSSPAAAMMMTRVASTQPVPRIMHSSQALPTAAHSSQVESQSQPAIGSTMSQPVGGKHGGRPPQQHQGGGKKKAIKKEVKSRGFR